MKKIKLLYPSTTIKRNPPVNLTPGDEQYFGGADFLYTTPESNLLKYSNALVTHHGIIIKNLILQKNLIVSYETDLKSYRFRYLAHAFLKLKKVDLMNENKYLLIFDNYSGPKGLAHWYSDCLTRLVEIKDTLQDYIALVPYYYQKNKFIAESLELFGITKIYCIEENTKVKVRNLFVPEHIAPSGNFNPTNVHKLRDFFWSKNKLQLKFSLGERLYISRSRAEFRYVTNDKEVIELLSKYDFNVVYMEDYNLAEKVSMVYHAKYLVSIIGAAFSFVHFMQPGTNIMEFRKRNDGVNCIYWALTDAMNMNYYYQYGDAEILHEASYNFNLTIDIGLLKKNIELMISEGKSSK